MTISGPDWNNASLEEAVGHPALQFAVAEAWLTMPDWITRRSELIDIVDSHTATHRILLDVSLPTQLKEKLSFTPGESDFPSDPPSNGSHGSGKLGPEEELVLLPVVFLRRQMGLPELRTTVGENEVRVGALPKHLSDRLIQGIIGISNSRPSPGGSAVPPQMFECSCPEYAWICERSSCPGRTQAGRNLDLKCCPPPDLPSSRFTWPYCAYEGEDCTCVRQRCPSATIYPPVIGRSADRSLEAFLETFLATDYGMVLLVPASAVSASFKIDISFTRELTSWETPVSSKLSASDLRLWRRACLKVKRWFSRRVPSGAPIARCGPFQGVIERALAFPIPGPPKIRPRKAWKDLCEASAQTDALKYSWRHSQPLFRRTSWLRRLVGRWGAQMTIGVQTSSLGDAGSYHFLFGAPEGMQIVPSGSWLHDWPSWQRSWTREGLEPPLDPADSIGRKGNGYSDDFLPFSKARKRGDRWRLRRKVVLAPEAAGATGSPDPYVTFIPASGIDERVSISPQPGDLSPTSVHGKHRNRAYFSRGASLFALIQFRPKTELPLFGLISNGLLIGLLIALFLSQNSWGDREDAWVAVLLLVPALVAGLTAARQNPVAASLVRKYRVLLGFTAGLSALSAVLLLVGSASDLVTDEKGPQGGVPPTPEDPLEWSLNPLSGSGGFLGIPDVESLLSFIFLISLALFIYFLGQHLIGRAAARWADRGSANQLDIVSPTKGFKLDTLRRPWCDPMPSRPQNALDRLIELREAFGISPNGTPGPSMGLDTVVLSSQDLRAAIDKKGSGVEARLLEKYGVRLPSYVNVDDESRFQDGFIYENHLNDLIKTTLASKENGYLDLSPRHLASDSELEPDEALGLIPGSSDDDLDHFILTLLAMLRETKVIAQGCLLGEYGTPGSSQPLRSWKALPDLLVHESLLRGLVGVTPSSADSATCASYVPIDIKQGRILEAPPALGPLCGPLRPHGLPGLINSSSLNHNVMVFVSEATAKGKNGGETLRHPYYLAQLGLYSVLVEQARQICELLPPPIENKMSNREALMVIRNFLTSRVGSGEVSSRVTHTNKPTETALWAVVGNGSGSRLFLIKGTRSEEYLSKGIEGLISAQVRVSPQLLGKV